MRARIFATAARECLTFRGGWRCGRVVGWLGGFTPAIVAQVRVGAPSAATMATAAPDEHLWGATVMTNARDVDSLYDNVWRIMMRDEKTRRAVEHYAKQIQEHAKEAIYKFTLTTGTVRKLVDSLREAGGMHLARLAQERKVVRMRNQRLLRINSLVNNSLRKTLLGMFCMVGRRAWAAVVLWPVFTPTHAHWPTVCPLCLRRHPERMLLVGWCCHRCRCLRVGLPWVVYLGGGQTATNFDPHTCLPNACQHLARHRVPSVRHHDRN